MNSIQMRYCLLKISIKFSFIEFTIEIELFTIKYIKLNPQLKL